MRIKKKAKCFPPFSSLVLLLKLLIVLVSSTIVVIKSSFIYCSDTHSLKFLEMKSNFVYFLLMAHQKIILLSKRIRSD